MVITVGRPHNCGHSVVLTFLQSLQFLLYTWTYRISTHFMHTWHTIALVMALFAESESKECTTSLFLLSMCSSEKAHRVMTCVRASNDETSPIQIWNCDQDDPQKVYLYCC